MKFLLLGVLSFAIAAFGRQNLAPVEAQSTGDCSPNILSNQGKVEFTCNTPMDAATVKKIVSLLNQVLRTEGKSVSSSEEMNRKLDELLAFVKNHAWPTVRELTNIQKQGIADFLKTIPQSIAISVGSVVGSGDGDNYANQFLPLLEGRRYDNQTASSLRTGFSVEFTGVYVATVTDDDPAAQYRDAFVRKLIDLGIDAHAAKGSKVSPGNLELLIGYRPEEVRRQ